MTPSEVADLIAVLPEIADRAGLVWAVRAGTVAQSTEVSALVRMDGDTVPIPVILLNGAVLTDARVWVLSRSDGGSNYMIGYAKETLLYSSLTICNSTLTPLPTGAAAAITGGAGIIAGTRVDINTPACRWEVIGNYDMRSTGAGVTTIVGALAVDDFAETGTFELSLALKNVTVSGERGTHMQQWGGTLAAGTHSFELYGFRTAAAGTQTIEQDHTTMRLNLWA